MMERIVCAWAILAVLVSGCLFNSNGGQENVDTEYETYESPSGPFRYSVSTAPEWTGLFKRSSGWIGGDGIFAIPLNGVEAPGTPHARTMFIFSDTIIGEIEMGGLQGGLSFVHNSVAYLNGESPSEDSITFYWEGKADSNPSSLFSPDIDAFDEESYFWLGDGFANPTQDGDIYLFAYEVKNTGSGDFSFEVVGNALIVIPSGSEPPFENQRQFEVTPLPKGEGQGSLTPFGAGIFVNTEFAGAPSPDGYVYIYGVRGSHKGLLAARVEPENIDEFRQWSYRCGETWCASPDSASAIVNNVSNELSVHPVAEDKYMLTFQVGGVGSNEVGMRIGSSPVGPFGETDVIWEPSEPAIDSNIYTYNAKAHPNISEDGSLLISYNVNAFNFFDTIEDHPNLYRPRFIQLEYEP